MFFKKSPSNQEIKSLIGVNTTVNGKILFSEGLRIDGLVNGDVIADPLEKSLLILSNNAVIEGNVRAEHIISNGTIKGMVHASTQLVLQPKAKIEGDIEYSAIEVHHGAVISGLLRHQIPKQSKPPVSQVDNKLQKDNKPDKDGKSDKESKADKVEKGGVKDAAQEGAPATGAWN